MSNNTTNKTNTSRTGLLSGSLQTGALHTLFDIMGQTNREKALIGEPCGEVEKPHGADAKSAGKAPEIRMT